MRPWLRSKFAGTVFPSHGLNSSEHHVRLNDVADLNMSAVEVTLDTSHFEMSELNALAPLNAAESKKKKKSERVEKSFEEIEVIVARSKKMN